MKNKLDRRKAVMSRSIKLGHCVCNPKKPCPCETFEKHNICTCAGEKLPVKTGNVRLSRYVRKAGCASKIGQADLKRILSKLPEVTNPAVLVGTAAGDDAAVYRLDGRFSLVQTVDVFSPNVDDAYMFGKIAAANSVSDVYAMGGKPLTALSVVGFPIEELDGSIMEEMLRGGMEKLEEAGCSLVGGHSINDEEVKCGFAVTGIIDHDKFVTRDSAEPGDALVLTKPLGTGMIAFAAQIGRISESRLNDAGKIMASLNKDAAELMIKHHAHACTDVTGFALMGHLVEMITGSGVSAEIDIESLPVMAPVQACLENEILPGAIERNYEYAMAWFDAEDSVEEKHIPIFFDPQTSGGLLVALPEDKAREYVKEMKKRGHDAATIIGRIVEKKGDSRVHITGSGLKNFFGEFRESDLLEKEKAEVMMKEEKQSPAAETNEEEPCCANPPGFEDEEAGDYAAENPVLRSPALFANFMKEANRPGLIGAKEKKITAIALSIAQKCRPCLKIHIKKALDMGISKAAIDEAAWLAISFCGSPAMLFYKEVCEELGIK